MAIFGRLALPRAFFSLRNVRIKICISNMRLYNILDKRSDRNVNFQLLTKSSDPSENFVTNFVIRIKMEHFWTFLLKYEKLRLEIIYMNNLSFKLFFNPVALDLCQPVHFQFHCSILIMYQKKIQKAGRFAKVLDFARSHSIVTRGPVSRAPRHHTLPAFLNFNGMKQGALVIQESQKGLFGNF